MQRIHYFAYGSNLDRQDLQDFCAPRHHRAVALERVIGPATLEGFRLVFGRYSSGRDGGVLDLWESPGDTVHGVLFEVDEAELALLDAKEGHPNFYRRTPVCVRVDGAPIDALTYIGRPDQRRLTAPQPTYVECVRRGYEAHRLPAEALEALDRALFEAEATRG